MMYTYLLLNIIFMIVVTTLLHRYLPKYTRHWFIMAGLLLVLTAVFDNVIILLDIVAYNPHKILGLYIYKAPVEDFFYALLAVIIVPSLWKYFEPTNEKKEKK